MIKEIQVRILTHLLNMAEDHCKKSDVTLTVFINQCIRYYLYDRKKEESTCKKS
jgi:hypothetical protein